MITKVWKPEFASLYKGIDPQRVADEIEQIGENFTPQQIVEKARDPQSELHKCFEWDDTIAAERWRKYQARQICCHLIIKENQDDNIDGKEHVPLRFVYNNDGKSYKTVQTIFRNEDEYKKLLISCQGELNAIKRKYSMLSEFDAIWELIN